jgi:DNA invertase Pin-like site-specific DNA recombinase
VWKGVKFFVLHVAGNGSKALLVRPVVDVTLSVAETMRVHSMDRLARNLVDLLQTVETLTSRGVKVEFVKEQKVFTDEDDPMSTMLIRVLLLQQPPCSTRPPTPTGLKRLARNKANDDLPAP